MGEGALYTLRLKCRSVSEYEAMSTLQPLPETVEDGHMIPETVA